MGGQSGQEHRTSKGNIAAYTAGPLKRAPYRNEKIEAELVDFKKEIEEKFAASKIRSFKFPYKKVQKLPEAMRNSRYGSNDMYSEREAAPGIGAANSGRKGGKQSSFVSYQNDQLLPRPHYGNDSPKKHGIQGPGIGKHSAEQSRYNDIMRSINSTEQFIKAKQAMAAQERKAGRNHKKNLHMTEIQAIANSTNSSLMQQAPYPKNPYDQPGMMVAPLSQNRNPNHHQGKIKMKLGQSPERTRNENANLTQLHQDSKASPVRKGAKLPKNHYVGEAFNPSSNLRDTIAKIGKNARVDQSLQLNNNYG